MTAFDLVTRSLRTPVVVYTSGRRAPCTPSGILAVVYAFSRRPAETARCHLGIAIDDEVEMT